MNNIFRCTTKLKEKYQDMISGDPSKMLETRQLEHEIYVITGGSSGVGFGIAQLLALYNPKLIIITSRSEDKGALAVSQLKELTGFERYKHEMLDLNDFQSTDQFASKLISQVSYISGLILNAGNASLPSGAETSKDGLPSLIQTNVIGHQLLVRKLSPLLWSYKAEFGRPSRVIFQSSLLHWLGMVNFKISPKLPYVMQYNDTKLMVLIQTKGFAAEFEESSEGAVKVHASHPGVVNTPQLLANRPFYQLPMFLFMKYVFAVPVTQGAKTSVFLATDPSIDQQKSGQYWANCKPQTYRSIADDDKFVKETMEILDGFCSKHL